MKSCDSLCSLHVPHMVSKMLLLEFALVRCDVVSAQIQEGI